MEERQSNYHQELLEPYRNTVAMAPHDHSETSLALQCQQTLQLAGTLLSNLQRILGRFLRPIRPSRSALVTSMLPVSGMTLGLCLGS
jgi:hypothetical protein